MVLTSKNTNSQWQALDMQLNLVISSLSQEAIIHKKCPTSLASESEIWYLRQKNNIPTKHKWLRHKTVFTINGYEISIIQLSKWLSSHINSFPYYFLISDSANIYAAPTGQDTGNKGSVIVPMVYCVLWEQEKHLEHLPISMG